MATSGTTTTLVHVSEQHEESIREALENALAPSTRRAYASHWRSFSAWCAVHGYTEAMFAPLTVTAYLSSLTQRSPSTVESARAAILHYADAESSAILRSHEGLRTALAGVRRTTRRGHTTSKARALSSAEIRSMVAASSGATPAEIRDRAMFLVMIALGLRASDAVTLDLADLRRVPSGMVVTVRYSKTSDLPVDLALSSVDDASCCPVVALSAWVNIIRAVEPEGVSEGGPLFRAVRRGGWNVSGTRLSVDAVGDVIRRMAERASGVSTEGLSSHSCRATYATRSLEAGVPREEVRRTGRWSSESVMSGYVRSQEMWSRPASSWLGTI